jgi:LPXTG-motif cell wall-anchored protein
VTVTANGQDYTQTFTVDCDLPGQPAVEIVQSCANEDGVVVVTLKNVGGQLPLTFTVEGVDYVVPAGSSVPVTISGLLDGTQTIAIHQGELDLSQTVTIDCDQAPTVTFAESCVEGANGHADGRVVVTLHNNGDDVAVTFTVNGTPYPVEPKASQDVTIDGLSDGVHHIAVLAGTVDLSFDVTVACDHPGEASVSSTIGCASADGVVTVSLGAAGGEQPVTFNVRGVQYIVQPDTVQSVVISGLADGTNHISVFQGARDLSFDIYGVCDVQVSPPVPAVLADPVAVLPATGASNLTGMLTVGFGALLLGGALLLFKRRLGTR